MLEIKPFTPSDLDIVTGMAREQDFAPGVGDIEIYANTDRQGIWLAWQDNLPVGCIAAVTYSSSYAFIGLFVVKPEHRGCLLYTSPSPRDLSTSRMPSSA